MNAIKFLPIVTSVLRKYRRAVQGLEESEVYLRELSENIDAQTRQKWDEQISAAQIKRTAEIEAMDVFDTTFGRGSLQCSLYGIHDDLSLS
jgi:hypothetical protein